ncbi:MAG: PTS galactosamine transporter subunit IIC [Erysipelotrichaceae bacterium]|nr:PTS galactosamine transporter subunit IIC [Erysipelotrichaceae bacterium]MDY5252965.1 PTS galactosamine transporter subunit IIC [Erysipelotrichaceae bacterium]
MEITFIQGILLAIMAVIVGLDFFLEAFFIFRPLMVSTFTGIILGDVTLGLKVGALIELAFAGLTPAGGTQPPNPVFAGLMGTVLAYTTGSSPEAALGLCLPFSFLGQYVILFYYSSFSFFMAKADKAASEGDTKTIRNINLTTMAIVSLTYGLLAFLCTYVAQAPMAAFVNSLPAVITHGLEVAGGILPAVGFGMLLRVMMKVKYTPYFIAGFLMACFCDMPNLLPVALLGTIFALIDFFNAKQRKADIEEALQNASVNNYGGDQNVGI